MTSDTASRKRPEYAGKGDEIGTVYHQMPAPFRLLVSQIVLLACLSCTTTPKAASMRSNDADRRR
jgi:hypothetical protein